MKICLNNTLRDKVKENVRKVCSKGQTVKLIKNTVEDSFGEGTTQTELALKAFPVRYAPFRRNTTAKVQWAEEADVLSYVSKKAVELLDLDLDDLQAYHQIAVGNKIYKIYKIEPYGSIADDFNYFLIGGQKT